MPETVDAHLGIPNPYDHIAAAHNRLKLRDSLGRGAHLSGIGSTSGSGSGSGSSLSSSTDSTSSATTIGFADIVHHTGTATATTILQGKASSPSNQKLPTSNSGNNTIHSTITVNAGGQRGGGNTPTPISPNLISGPLNANLGHFEIENIDTNSRPRRAPAPPPLQHLGTHSQPLHRHHSTIGFTSPTVAHPPNPTSIRASLSMRPTVYDHSPDSIRPSASEARRQSAYINLHPHNPLTRSYTSVHTGNTAFELTASSNSSINNTSTQKKRTSRITSFLKRSSTSSTPKDHSRPKISEPVLEYSTTDLLPEYQCTDVEYMERKRALQRQSQLHLNTNTSLKTQRRQSEDFYRRLSRGHLPTLIDLPIPPKSNSPVTNSPLIPVDSIGSSFGGSVISVNSHNTPALQLLAQNDTPTISSPSTPTKENKQSESTSPPSPSMPILPIQRVIPLTPTDSAEVKELRMKLKESDDRRRLMMIEYQQKLDSERKRTLELQKRIEQLKTEKYQQAPIDPKSRIKMVEAQRDALRTALNQLREAKTIEIAEYRSRLGRLSRPNLSTSISEMVQSEDDHSPDASPARKLDNELPPLLRSGISPLLPIGQPVHLEKNFFQTNEKIIIQN